MSKIHLSEDQFNNLFTILRNKMSFFTYHVKDHSTTVDDVIVVEKLSKSLTYDGITFVMRDVNE